VSDKFKTADQYVARGAAADCEVALVVLLQTFGSLKGTLRLVGGLVPRYLTPAKPPDVPEHVGTMDVDIVLNIAVLADKGGYASLRKQLKNNGFERYEPSPGKISTWQWTYQVQGRPVVVEFLQHTDDAGSSGTLLSIDGEDVSGMQFLHVGMTHDWYREREITVELPDGNGIATESIRFADPVAFIVLKAMAFNHRGEPKDAADLIHVMRYSGPLQKLADLYAERLKGTAHVAALEEGLRCLAAAFCDELDIEGWRKQGPSKFAKFHQVGEPGSDEFVRTQRDANGLVEEFLTLVGSQPAS
jgi:hypothetical protein